MKTNQDLIGIGIIGCGYWGMNYVRLFDELADSRVTAVCDKRPERLLELPRTARDARRETCVDAVLNSPEVEAVVVCTEASSHYETARQALLAGKHVLVEKPLTTCSREAEQLTVLAESLGRVLMVGHTFVYNSGVRKVKECMEQCCERVYYLHACRTNLGPIRRDVNALWDLATHDIAIFNYLLNQVPEWVSAVGANVLGNCREDVGFVSLGYPGNILGHIHVSWADPNKAREIVVVCSDKRIVFNDLNGLERVRIFEKGVSTVKSEEPQSFGEYQLLMRDGDILSPRVPVTEPLKEQCRHFLECIRQGTRPISSGWEGRDVLRVLEAVNQSMRLRGAHVPITSEPFLVPNRSTYLDEPAAA